MLTRLTFVFIILVALITGGGLVADGVWSLAAASLALGGLWLLSHRKGWDGMASVLLILFVALAGFGIELGRGKIWAPPVVVIALAAWDLGRFTARLRGNEVTDETRELERRHLLRLVLVSGIGLALSWGALTVQFRLGFALAVALGFIAIIGLSQVVRSLARESD